MALSSGEWTALIGAISTGVAAIGGAIRWSAGIVRDAIAATAENHTTLLKESNQVIRDNTAAFTKVAEALGRVDVRTEDAGKRLAEIHAEVSDVHAAAPQPYTQDGGPIGDSDDTPVVIGRPQTPARGVAAVGGPQHPRPQSQPYALHVKRKD